MFVLPAKSTKKIGALSLAVLMPFAMTACSNSDTDSSSSSTHAVTDMSNNSVEVPDKAQNIVATDNLIFDTLEAWDIKLSAVPKEILPKDSKYVKDSNVQDVGDSKEPNMEQLVGVNPDLVLNGYRFETEYDQIAQLVPDAALVNTTVNTRDDSDKFPLEEELRRQTELLGKIFDREKDAEKIIDSFDKAIANAQEQYNTDETVMGLISTGGTVQYSAPIHGRAVGQLFPMIGLTPALQADGSTNHKGDDISIEAIAEANPDWMIVLDRDAAIDDEDDSDFTPAQDIIKNNPALANVTAVQKNQIIYLPKDFYLTESIQAYTKLLNQIAQAFKDAE